MQVKAGDVKESDAIYPLVKTLSDAGVSGSMAIAGACEGPAILIPIGTHANGSGNLVEVVKEMLREDSSMQVRQDRDGTIRMNERGVPEDILHVKIRELNFGKSAGLYVPDEAVLWIMGAPEVTAFRKSHDIEWVPLPVGGTGNFGPALSELPHVSGSLENVTVAEVLDHFLKTFPGIWVYKNCPAHEGKRRTVYFRFLNTHKAATGLQRQQIN